MSDQEVRLRVRIETEAWASPAAGMTLAELVERLRALGNRIIEVDHERKAVLIAREMN
jgi:uncharacterized protein (DUF1786 family)